MVIRLFLVLKSFKMRPQTMAFLFNCRLNKIKLEPKFETLQYKIMRHFNT